VTASSISAATVPHESSSCFRHLSLLRFLNRLVFDVNPYQTIPVTFLTKLCFFRTLWLPPSVDSPPFFCSWFFPDKYPFGHFHSPPPCDPPFYASHFSVWMFLFACVPGFLSSFFYPAFGPPVRTYSSLFCGAVYGLAAASFLPQ